MLYKFTHCVRHILANTKPDQLRWGDREMGTAISCIESSQMPSLNEKVVENPSKARLFVQLLISSCCCSLCSCLSF